MVNKSEAAFANEYWAPEEKCILLASLLVKGQIIQTEIE